MGFGTSIYSFGAHFFVVLGFHVGFKPLLALHSLDFELFLTPVGFIPALTHSTEFQSSRNSLA